MDYQSKPHRCSCGNQYFVELERFEENGTHSPHPEEHSFVVHCPLCQRLWIHFRDKGWTEHGYLAVEQIALKVT